MMRERERNRERSVKKKKKKKKKKEEEEEEEEEKKEEKFPWYIMLMKGKKRNNLKKGKISRSWKIKDTEGKKKWKNM